MACVISAISSNSGKTLLSILLISWLKSINKTVQTFKVGPDYLDPNPESFAESSSKLSDEIQKSYDESRYDWSPETGGVFRLTKSSLLGFHFCPYQYWLEKFQGHRGEETMWNGLGH